MHTTSRVGIKDQIINALSHEEAEEGLYFHNFFELCEEDERPPVGGREEDILDALNELIKEGKVAIDEQETKITFNLIKA